MTAMYLATTLGSILNSVELVNAMVLEHVKPDSFIAGGLELSDDTGMHAYIVRVNLLYYSVLYGMRYRLRAAAANDRRTLQETFVSQSVVKGMAWVDAFLYLNVDYTESSSSLSRVAILMVHLTTGQIVKQVQLYAADASFSCTDIARDGQYLVLSCAMAHKEYLLSMDQELTLSQLPEGVKRYENSTFIASAIKFYRTMLPLSMESADRNSNDYSFITTIDSPTLRPSVVPTQHPSSSFQPSRQPSSSPTSGPSVSPQPTSQPSSSGPTNTYKPTVKPTQRPSAAPSREPTRSPTVKPTAVPTARPSVTPSALSTTQPSLAPMVLPTRRPSAKPSRSLTNLPTLRPTQEPSVAPTVEAITVQAKAPNNNQAYLIVGYVVAGLAGLWLLYILRRWCQYKLDGVQSDANRTLYVESIAAKPKARFPVCAFIVSLFHNVEAAEIDFITIETPTRKHRGVGANAEGPDLEANERGRGKTKMKKHYEKLEHHPKGMADQLASGAAIKPNSIDMSTTALTSNAQTRMQSDSESDVDVVLSKESSYANEHVSRQWEEANDAAFEEWSEGGSSVVYSLSTDEGTNSE